MRFIEPQHTLCWTAWHVFDKLFLAKYETGKLTMNEYCELINTVIARRELHIVNNRKWFQFRLRWKDGVFLRRCTKLKQTIEPKRSSISVAPLKERSTQKPWGGEPLNTSKNAKS